MVAESEVPLGTIEPVLFPGASVVRKGTQCLDHPIFPALKRRAIFSEHKDAKYDLITPRVFKLSHYHRIRLLDVSTCGAARFADARPSDPASRASAGAACGASVDGARSSA